MARVKTRVITRVITRILAPALAALLAVPGLDADTKKLTTEQKMELLRGLSSEFAIAKIVLPRSRKALPMTADGARDEKKWQEANYKEGPAARPGDMVQITKVEIDDDKITIELNDGTKKGSFWDRVQIGMGPATSPVSTPRPNAAAGTSIEIRFEDSIAGIDAAGVKRILSAVMDFDKRSATEVYVETLPEPIQEAIKAEKAVEGMDREMVAMALGTPRSKVRETKEDVDYETWIYGQPPGVMTFVEFAGSKVVKVEELYAGIGGSVAKIPGPDK
jgi:hypothetical protein